MDLAGKVCLITGGTSGIGAASALEFARHGADIAIAARKAPAETGELLSETKKQGRKMTWGKIIPLNTPKCRSCVSPSPSQTCNANNLNQRRRR